MTRVAYVCADPGVPVFAHKGCSVHVREVCGALLEAGCEVTLLASRPEGERPARLSALRVMTLPRRSARDAAERELVLAAANADTDRLLTAAGPFDIVYERAALWSVAPMTYARREHAVGVLELNAPLVDEQTRYRTLVHEALANRLLAAALRSAHVVTAVSPEVARWAAARIGAPHSVHVVANGVDVRRFRPRAGGATGRFVVGFVGTLKPWHGLETLVEAFPRLLAAVPHAELLIVGEGPERSRLTSAVVAGGIEARVTFTGAVPHDAVPRWLQRMDVAVAPYPDLHDFYFFPLKLVEYMASGLAVVASRVGQVATIVEHGRTGLLVPPGDAGALADALAALSARPAWRARLGRAARDVVVAKHTWTAVVDQVLSLAAAHGRLVPPQPPYCPSAAAGAE